MKPQQRKFASVFSFCLLILQSAWNHNSCFCYSFVLIVNNNSNRCRDYCVSTESRCRCCELSNCCNPHPVSTFHLGSGTRPSKPLPNWPWQKRKLTVPHPLMMYTFMKWALSIPLLIPLVRSLPWKDWASFPFRAADYRWEREVCGPITDSCPCRHPPHSDCWSTCPFVR